MSNLSLVAWRTRAERLSDLDKKLLKPLYAGLKKLTAEERDFLMQKYYYPEKPISDEEMAGRTGLTYHQYGDKRREIESKLVTNKPLLDITNRIGNKYIK